MLSNNGNSDDKQYLLFINGLSMDSIVIHRWQALLMVKTGETYGMILSKSPSMDIPSIHGWQNPWEECNRDCVRCHRIGIK